MKTITFLMMILILMGVAYGATPECGGVIDTSVVFDSDILDCMNADNPPIFWINASDIVIDCAGYTIQGNVDYSVAFGGMNNADFDNVEIKNCVMNTDIGVYHYEGQAYGWNLHHNTWAAQNGDWCAFANFQNLNNVIMTENILILNGSTWGDSLVYEWCNVLQYNGGNLSFFRNTVIGDVAIPVNPENGQPAFFKITPYGLQTAPNKYYDNIITNQGDGLIWSFSNVDSVPNVDNEYIFHNNFYGSIPLFDYRTNGENVNLLSNDSQGNYWEACGGVCSSPFVDGQVNGQGFFNFTDLNAVLTPFTGIGGTGAPSPCTPDWTCSGYGACNESDLQPCNAVTDLNTCGDAYSGDYSEFTPQACDFCTPSWSCSLLGECVQGDIKPCVAVVDANTCSESFTGNLSDYDGSCNYVSDSSNNGPFQFCTPEGECFESIAAYEKSIKPTLFAGGNLETENPFTRFFTWLKELLWSGEDWP